MRTYSLCQLRTLPHFRGRRLWLAERAAISPRNLITGMSMRRKIAIL